MKETQTQMRSVREREFGMYDEDGMFTSEYLRENTTFRNPL